MNGFNDFSVGDKVLHAHYGKAVIVRKFDELKNASGKGNVQDEAILLELTSSKGKKAFSRDRNGELRFCYEDRVKLINKIS